MRNSVFIFLTALTVAATSSAAFAQANAPDPTRSAPPSKVVASTKAAIAPQFVSAAPAGYVIDAGPLGDTPEQRLKSAVASTEKQRQATIIGFPREIPEALRSVPLSVVPWKAQADGSQTFKFDLLVSEAAGSRVAYRFEGPAGGAEIRFAGNGNVQVFRSEIAAQADVVWSPVLEGDRATIELRVLAGQDPKAFRLTLEKLSHLTSAGKSVGQNSLKASGACNIDVTCELDRTRSRALADIAASTMRILVTKPSGATGFCSGTLINSLTDPGAPYVYTGAHCVDNQREADTINTTWFFQSVACNSAAIPPSQSVDGGATVVVRDDTMDLLLLKLKAAPPTGAVFAGWDATVLGTSTPVVGVHHPSGDLKKFSEGNVLGYGRGPREYTQGPNNAYLRDSNIDVRWSRGTTEGGSSGSGLFTFAQNCDGAGNACFYLRGALRDGEASCGNLSGVDSYGRMDIVFTKVAPFLNANARIPASNSVTGTMVEYFMPEFDYYFMTSRENEKAALDSVVDALANPLWYRTGYWFKVDNVASSTASSLVRYFSPGVAKGERRGSHFYSALNSDKQGITASGLERVGAGCNNMPNKYFCNEGIDSFISLPVGVGPSASCFADEQPIYRVFRGAPYVDDANHRFVTNRTIYDYMTLDLRWAGEFINFCAKR
jgi:lysyl endopeptidase